MSDRKMILRYALVLGIAVLTACEIGTPIYRANAKLLVTKAGHATPVSDLVQEDDGRFVDTQIAIMLTETMKRRVQARMRKTGDEIRENLSGLKIARLGNTQIITITVTSKSPDFARDFANTIMDEYIRFREEQLAQFAETALLQLTRVINQVGADLKTNEARVVNFAKERNVSMDDELPELKRMRDERDSLRKAYNVLLEQLIAADVAQGFPTYYVTVLERASVEGEPIRRFKP